MKKERFKLFFAKYRWILIITIFIGLFIAIGLLIESIIALLSIYNISQGVVGIFGAILGAIFGGIFTLLGTVSVSKRQLKTQTYIKRKNVIYKPLYDELKENHEIITNKDHFPFYIAFKKEVQNQFKSPQYTAWGRIKMDTRYLETPKHLKESMEQLYAKIKEYSETFYKIDDAVISVLNVILQKKAETSYSTNGIDNSLLTAILDQKHSNKIPSYVFGFLKPKVEIGDELKEEISTEFFLECEKLSKVIQVREARRKLIKAEEETIELLGTMIQYINIRYEG